MARKIYSEHLVKLKQDLRTIMQFLHSLLLVSRLQILYSKRSAPIRGVANVMHTCFMT